MVGDVESGSNALMRYADTNGRSWIIGIVSIGASIASRQHAIHLGSSMKTKIRSIVIFSVLSNVVLFTTAATLHAQAMLGAPEFDEPSIQQGLPTALSLADVTNLALQQNPRLAQAGLAIEAARGNALQAGLYPNPTVSANFDELGDRTGPGGINTVPLITQEIVTAKKLRLSRSAALQKVDQAEMQLIQARYSLLTKVRQTFFEVLAAQERVRIYSELLGMASNSYANAKKRVKAGEASNAGLLQFEVQLYQIRANLEAAQQELLAARPKLAATAGVDSLPPLPLTGSITLIPPMYDSEQAQAVLVANHPAVYAAQAGIRQAELQLKRAQKEPIPNITIGAGYVRQNQNGSDDWVFQVGMPIPLFNRNQGNVLAARARLGHAIQEVERVRFALSRQFATQYGKFAAARKRAELYRTYITPKARQSYKLTLAAFRGGQFEYLQVIQAQRAIADAEQEFVRAMSDQWQAAAVLAGLLLEDHWPPAFVECVEELPKTSK